MAAAKNRLPKIRSFDSDV